MTEYPCGLPGVLRSGYGYSPKPTVARTPIAQGPGVYTPHDDGGWMAFNVSWLYDTCGMQTFRNWFRQTIRGGALPFTIGREFLVKTAVWSKSDYLGTASGAII